MYIEDFDFLPYVLAGVEYLDNNKKGWENLISLQWLNVGSPARCVLGQVFEEEYLESAEREYNDNVGDGFSWALEFGVNGNFPKPMEQGFDMPDFYEMEVAIEGEDEDNFNEEVYEYLTNTWKTVIKARLNNKE